MLLPDAIIESCIGDGESTLLIDVASGRDIEWCLATTVDSIDVGSKG